MRDLTLPIFRDNTDLWLEWLLAQDSGDYVPAWPTFRDLCRDARIRRLLADSAPEDRDSLVEVVAVILGVTVQHVRDLVGG